MGGFAHHVKAKANNTHYALSEYMGPENYLTISMNREFVPSSHTIEIFV